jgi:hypothetical protein
MNRNVSHAAKVLGVDVPQVKQWAHLFKEYLSGRANPAKGRPRLFCDTDLLVLSFVCLHWEESPDIEAIRIGLNQEDHYEEELVQNLYSYTPLLQDPPDDLDETWRHGVLLNGANLNEDLELARNYRHCAEVLLDSALKDGEPFAWVCPVLFAYRHTLELYLKLFGEITELTHSLERCVTLVESHHGKRIASPVREWILELDEIDPRGTTFRYADEYVNVVKWDEKWVDFVQFKFAMGRVFERIDFAVLRGPPSGAPYAKGSKSKRPKR